MKMITNLNHIDIHTNTEMDGSSSSSSYSTAGLNDLGEQVTSQQLISCINAQFDQIYKENQKRRYLLKEISGYLSK